MTSTLKGHRSQITVMQADSEKRHKGSSGMVLGEQRLEQFLSAWAFIRVLSHGDGL